MIRSIKNLGIYSLKETEEDSSLNNLLEDVNLDYVLLLKLKDKKEIEYDGIDLEEYDNEYKQRYLYKKGSPRGGDITPSSIYFRDSKKKDKSLNRYLLSFSKINNEYFKKLDNFFKIEENKKRLLNDIESKIENKKKYLLSLKIGDKYLKDIKEVFELLKINSNKRFSTRDSFPKEERISQAENHLCYLCGKTTTVNGFTNTFQFYTLDKKGFMTGGFDRKFAWRNYPICGECGSILEAGKKILKEDFKDSFGGLTYFIIPNFILEINTNKNYEIYKKIIRKFINKNIKKISLAENKREGLMKGEDKILTLASKMENNINFNIMFYKEQNSEFKILQNVEDVFPSRLAYLLEVKDEIENTNKYTEFSPIKGKYILKINFSNLKKFFSSEKLFLECLNNIYTNKKIDGNFMVSLFINKIRESYIEEKNILSTTLESFMWYKFLVKINIINNYKKEKETIMIEKTEKNKIYLDFLSKHNEVLDKNIKIGIFLEGILIQKLLRLPEQESKSFYSRLNGIKLNEKIIKRILAEAINKLNEYKKNYYTELEKLISYYLLNSDFKELTNDEMSYYFVLGMNLSSEFKINKGDEK